MNVPETDLGREVRAAVAAALKRFGENDIAALKVSTLRQLDRYLNPEPDTFRIPVERDTPAYLALEQARVDRLRDADDVMRGMR